MARNKLNYKQELFCDLYIKLGCSQHGTEAAIKAGYSAKSATVIASELLTRPNIQAYLTKRKHEFEELLGFNKATVLQDLHTIKNKAMVAIPVMEYDRKERKMVQATAETEEGKEVGLYTFDSNGANRAIENISKMMGYNEPEKIEDVTPNKQPIVVVNKTYVNKEPDKSTT